MKDQRQENAMGSDPIVQSATNPSYGGLVPSDEDASQLSQEDHEQDLSGQEDGSGTSEEPAGENIDYVSEAKKFQSLYDKQVAENNKIKQELEQIIPLKTVLEQRPDLVDVIREKLEGGQPSGEEEVKIDETSFDPWDAYYKPDSQSYKWRISQEKAIAEQIVNDKLSELQQQVALANLRNELSNNYNMQDDDVSKFIEFATTSKDQLPIDILVDVFNKHYNKGSNVTSENIEATRRAQNIPKPAGILQGGTPKDTKSDEDKLWENILKAGGTGIIP